MSALTDLFTSLANKIRSKLGTSTTYTPAQAISAIDDVYTAGDSAGYARGVAATKVGTAGQAQVLSGYTFTNSSSVGASGTMANRSRGVGTGANAQLSSSDNCPVYEVAGHYAAVVTNTDGVNRLCFAIPADGYYGENNDVIGLNTAYIGNAPTSAVREGYTFTSSSGRQVSGAAPAHPHVSVTAGSAGIVDNKPFIWIPWGHYDNAGNDHCGIYTSEAVAQAIHRHTGTYTFPANDTGGTKDLGEFHGYRYVNAANVYAKGVADGIATPSSYQVLALEGSNTITRSNLDVNGIYILTISVWGNRWPTFTYSGITVLYQDRAVGVHADSVTTTLLVVFSVNNASNTFTTGGAGSGTGTTTLVRVY